MTRISAIVALLALAGHTAVYAAEPNSNLPVAVHVEWRASESEAVLPIAQASVSKMFAQANVRVAWQAIELKSSAQPTLFIDVTDGPENSGSSVLAYAQAFEGVHIVVFYDRVQRLVGLGASPMLRGRLLAHVLVHEITHILEGTDSHSPEGIMKARWGAADIARIRTGALSFDPHDLILIRSGVSRTRQQQTPTMLVSSNPSPGTMPTHQ